MTPRLCPRSLLFGLFGCLVAASWNVSATSISIGTSQERSRPILVSPHRCPYIIPRAHEGETERTIPTLTPTPTYHNIKSLSTQTVPCPTVTGLVNPLERRDDLGSLLENLDSLSLALVLASASALSLSQDLNQSLVELRASTSSLAASASSELLVAEASASSAVSSVEASASSALSAVQKSASVSASEALATRSSTRALPTDRGHPEAKRMAAKEISVTIAAIAIAVSGVGSALLAVLIFYLIMRRRKAQQHEKQQQQEEETEGNAALDRAIVSYIVKELPSPRDPLAPDAAQSLEQSMTNLMAAPETQTNPSEPGGPPRSPRARPQTQPSPQPQTQPPTPAEEPREFIRRTQSAPRASHRRTASSHVTDSAGQVYADILAKPLENAIAAPPPSLQPPPPPRPRRSGQFAPEERKDDIGWPLVKNSWM